jgi:hypothetical protein
MKVLLLTFSPRSVLNSLWSFINKRFHAIACRDGINHILSVINIIPRNVMVQLTGRLTILAGGSNIVLWIRLLKTKKKNTAIVSQSYRQNIINYTRPIFLQVKFKSYLKEELCLNC